MILDFSSSEHLYRWQNVARAFLAKRGANTSFKTRKSKVNKIITGTGGTYLRIGSGQVQAKNRKKIERSRTYTIPVLCTIVHITYQVLFFSITKRSAFLLKHYYGIGILLSSYNAGTGTYLNAMKLTLKSFFLKNKHRSDLNTIIKLLLNSVLRSRSRPF